MNKHPLFIAGGTSGILAALALPAGAAETVTAATYQTVLIPVELLLFAFAATLGLICFGAMQERAKAIWIFALSLLTSAFGLGCSFFFGRTAEIAGSVANIAITNIGVMVFAGALLGFSLLMLIYAIMAEMYQTAEAA